MKNENTIDKIQTGLRIPENQYRRIREEADRMGVSINQLILVLVDIGLYYLETVSDRQSYFVIESTKLGKT